jgi:hypothetical protein
MACARPVTRVGHVELGRVWSCFGFLVIIFGSGRVGTGFFSSGENFGPRPMSYGPPWAHYLGGYQDRLLGGPLGLPDLRCTAPDGVKHKDYRGEVLG